MTAPEWLATKINVLFLNDHCHATRSANRGPIMEFTQGVYFAWDLVTVVEWSIEGTFYIQDYILTAIFYDSSRTQ